MASESSFPGTVEEPTRIALAAPVSSWTNWASRYQQFLYGVAVGGAAVALTWSIRSLSRNRSS